jgi:hypothetical protein
MASISLSYIIGFFGSVLKLPIQMGSLSINNLVTNISHLGTFHTYCARTSYDVSSPHKCFVN